MKKLVSVIIPTLNEEKYLEKTLLSVKAQDYKPLEIIVSDGGSKDKTLKIAKRYADKIVKVEKRGISLGRNEGAKNSKGEILVFLDADTLMLPNTVSELVKCFKKGVVGATCPVFPFSTKIIDFLLYEFYNKNLELSLSSSPKVAGIICAYKRKEFFEVDGFDEKLKVMEDFDLSQRISKLGKIMLTKKTFVLTSTRRLEKWGKGRAALKYLKYYLNYLAFKKTPSLKEYKPIR